MDQCSFQSLLLGQVSAYLNVDLLGSDKDGMSSVSAYLNLDLLGSDKDGMSSVSAYLNLDLLGSDKGMSSEHRYVVDVKATTCCQGNSRRLQLSII